MSMRDAHAYMSIGGCSKVVVAVNKGLLYWFQGGDGRTCFARRWLQMNGSSVLVCMEERRYADELVIVQAS